MRFIYICVIPYNELEQASATVNAMRRLEDALENYKESDRRIVRHFDLFMKLKNHSN